MQAESTLRQEYDGLFSFASLQYNNHILLISLGILCTYLYHAKCLMQLYSIFVGSQLLLLINDTHWLTDSLSLSLSLSLSHSHSLSLSLSHSLSLFSPTLLSSPSPCPGAISLLQYVQPHKQLAHSVTHTHTHTHTHARRHHVQWYNRVHKDITTREGERDTHPSTIIR